MTSINTIARFTGCLYLLLIPLGVLGILYIPSFLFVPGDAATTADNVLANETLFRLGILSALAVQLVYIILVLFFYKLLKSVSRSVAILMVVLVLVAVPIAMLNELNHFAVLELLGNEQLLTIFTTDQEQAMATLFFELHDYGIIIAQIFWGLWLAPLGYLIFRSGYIPKFLGVLMVIACCGYVLDTFFAIFFPEFGFAISQFTFLGEVLLPLWLLIKGVNAEEWEKQNLVRA
ncbi:MAG: DUF4386 domain-containing protein [Gammaproteobacteria bacterium]|nr:DUF4386 domain-containing protein [Gammaproteobacteria bacterium]NNL51455.1 DUF4386 domain-containing protein [Woeseiaceae bacterium]